MLTVHTRRLPRHILWLLLVALLLPVAQTVATWHVLSTACTDRADPNGKSQSHPSHCDLCLTAASLHSGAASGVVISAPPAAGLHEAPRYLSNPLVSASPAWAYRSRAPPVALS
jgi:hypothetical protein